MAPKTSCTVLHRIAWLLTALITSTTLAADETEKGEAVEAQSLHFESRHQLRLDGETIDYDATAGTLLMKNSEGKPVAHFGYTAYVRRGQDSATRPVLFAYNGGPGSASMWLHMGILGPVRTVIEDLASNSEAPFRRVDNQYTILDRADLVMIDPVGTGFSRPAGDAEGEDFWGVDQDIESVSNFIARWTTDNRRWLSPKYLLGESYGGMRSGGVAYHLMQKHSIALNGVILVSPYMSFIAGNAGVKIDLPQVNFFTTFAATAWYHEAINDRPADLQAFLSEAEAFAIEEYAPLLHKGSRASDDERQRVLAGMERFTGISAEYWDRANLRINEGRFIKEVLRDRGLNVGRIDSRYTGAAINNIGEQASYDPYFPAVGPAFVATFNDYYRGDLGVETDRRYVTSGGLWRKWDKGHAQPGVDYGKMPIADTGIALAHTMIQNPKMRLLVQQGYYDLATPYGATQYFLEHMEIPANLQDNIEVEYYEAGHMMYVHPPSMAKYKNDLANFIR